MILRAQSRRECWREDARLPYSLAVNEVRRAVDSVYRFLHSINETLARQELGLLEDLILGNTFSGLLSEVVVKSIAREARAVVRNRYVGGHPDLIPASNPKGDSQLRCEQGIEVKTSLGKLEVGRATIQRRGGLWCSGMKQPTRPNRHSSCRFWPPNFP